MAKPKKRRVGTTNFDFDHDDPLFARPLSIEFEKKRAKKILKTAHLSGNTSLKLADVQFDLARQLGFKSWPKLKAHIEQAEIEKTAMESGNPTALDGGQTTLHIRCGTDIENGLKVAGFTGDFTAFYDPFVMGPVTQQNDLDDFIRQRSDFLVESGWINKQNAFDNHRKHHAALNKAREYQRVMLWFEHDSFDVLILAFLLNYFSDPARRPRQLQMVCATGYPGVKQFNGLGQLPPQALRVIWSWFKPVNEAQYHLGQKTWEALTSPTPEAVFQIVQSGTQALPPFAKALKRHLLELPSVNNGLSLVEELTLRALQQHGPQPAGRLFGNYIALEPLYYLGDLMHKTYIENLAAADNPAITLTRVNDEKSWWRRHRIELTQTGEDLLAAKCNWLEMGIKDRWVGGIQIKADKPGWKWDPDNNRPVYS